jgi:hypothetical protein
MTHTMTHTMTHYLASGEYIHDIHKYEHFGVIQDITDYLGITSKEEREAKIAAQQAAILEAQLAAQRIAEQKAAILAAQRAAEQRAIEQRAAEQRAAEQRAAEQRAAEQRAAEQRAAEQRAAEQRAAEQRAAEQRAIEQRAAEQRAVEQQAAEQRAAEQRALDAFNSLLNNISVIKNTYLEYVRDEQVKINNNQQFINDINKWREQYNNGNRDNPIKEINHSIANLTRATENIKEEARRSFYSIIHVSNNYLDNRMNMYIQKLRKQIQYEQNQGMEIIHRHGGNQHVIQDVQQQLQQLTRMYQAKGQQIQIFVENKKREVANYVAQLIQNYNNGNRDAAMNELSNQIRYWQDPNLQLF